jgi:hypothetical protein
MVEDPETGNYGKLPNSGTFYHRNLPEFQEELSYCYILGEEENRMTEVTILILILDRRDICNVSPV